MEISLIYISVRVVSLAYGKSRLMRPDAVEQQQQHPPARKAIGFWSKRCCIREKVIIGSSSVSKSKLLHLDAQSLLGRPDTAVFAITGQIPLQISNSLGPDDSIHQRLWR
jgi:hypothetical protein